MIRDISKLELDKFVSSCEYSQFLQSSSWGDFQKELGNKVWYIGLEENGEILSTALIVEKKMFMDLTYLYSPRGPIVSKYAKNSDECLKLIFKGVRDICVCRKNKGAVFFKFEPEYLNTKSFERIKKVKDFQPSKTQIIDLSWPEEKLLSQMHQKTRYNIRLAEKKGVEVFQAVDYREYFEDFWTLMSDTSGRDKFLSHSKEYYENILKTKAGGACLWLAKHGNDILAANIVMSIGDTVTYTHGASSNVHKNFMAPHLLQWRQIKWAKTKGYKYYDFWGISKTDSKNDKWAGFTRFKKGFGGFEKEYDGTYDLIFKSKYYKIYNILKRLKK